MKSRHTNSESYLHKMAKELLYQQVTETGEFKAKDAAGMQYAHDNEGGFVSHNPLMECPIGVSGDGR